MKIAIDGYEANVPQRLGSSQVAFELLRNLEKIDHKNNYNIFLPNPPMKDFPKERAGWRYKELKPRKFWTRIALPLALYKDKPDIIFSPTHYIPRFSPCKRIATVFDLSFLHFSEMFKKEDLWQLTNWTKFSIQNADHIITISNFSKEDISKTYGIKGEKITVAYPGFDEKIFKQIKEKNKVKSLLYRYNLMDTYIIYIGTIQPRKNLIRLMEVVKDIEDIHLVIVGKTQGEGRSGWMYEDILKTPERLGITDRVKFLGFVPTEELPYLLSGALAYIQPSLWEGFGIPTVEAMATGAPVLVANNSSLPEVIGDAGLIFDPYNFEDIKKQITKISTDSALRNVLSKKALQRAKKYSWKTMAGKIKEVFEKENK